MKTTSYISHLTSHASTHRSLFNSVRGEKGFSLVELIIVFALITIVSAIAAPQLMQMLPKMRVNTATREVMAKMMLVKMRAVSENKDYQLVFAAGSNQYSIKKDVTVIETHTLPSGIIIGTNVVAQATTAVTCEANGVCFGAGNDGPTFSRMGTVDSANKGSVYLIPQDDKTSGSTDRMRAVSADTSGRVKAWKYKGGGSPWGEF